MTDTDLDLPVIARPEELDYTLACAAYSNTSHTPERRARLEQEGFANDVNGFYGEMAALCTNEAQRAILDAEILRYKANYLKLYRAYLHSHSRVASSFITGPANFPVARNEKRSRWADNKLAEFTAWRTRARSAIRERILDARTEEEKHGAEWRALERDLARSLGVIAGIDEGDSVYTRSAFVTSIVGKVERLAQNGEAELVEKAVALVTEYNARYRKPAITQASKFWTFAAIAQANAALAQQPPAETETLHEGEGVTVLLNHALDRVQIVFEDVPAATLRERMNSAGWRWSRQERAWQRKLTEAAKYSAKQVLGLSEFVRAMPADEVAQEAAVPEPAPPPMTHAERLQQDRMLTLELDFDGPG